MKSVKAIWNGVVIAETNNPLTVEGNIYFPCKDVKMDLLVESETKTDCPWKERHPTIPLRSMRRLTKMPPGTTKLPRTKQAE